jgi:hypothetical protein
MSRYPNVAASEREALKDACAAARRAVTPAEINAGDKALFDRVSAAINALGDQSPINSEDKASIQRALDIFNDSSTALKVRVRDYNRQMLKALDTYNGLPTRALFPRPELIP